MTTQIPDFIAEQERETAAHYEHLAANAVRVGDLLSAKVFRRLASIARHQVKKAIAEKMSQT